MTDFNHPEFGFSAHSSVLDKIKVINKYFDGMGLSSTFSLKQSRTHSSSSADQTYNTTYDYAPLISLDGSLKKWPIKFNYQHTMNQDTKTSGENATITSRSGDNMDINYEIPQSTGTSTIKIFKWKIPIKGRTTMGMRISIDHSTTVVGKDTSSNVSNFSVGPHIGYVFTDNVTGTLEYTGSQAKQNGQTTTSNIVALIAEIKF
jgi:hypothetical protein